MYRFLDLIRRRKTSKPEDAKIEAPEQIQSLPIYVPVFNRTLESNVQMLLFILPNIINTLDEIENILIFLSSYNSVLGRDVTRDYKQLQRIKKHFIFWYTTFNYLNEGLFKNRH